MAGMQAQGNADRPAAGGVKEFMESLGYRDFSQNNPHHFGTLSQHVEKVLEYICGIEGGAYAGRPEVMAAALMHDVGKYEMRTVNEKTGYDSFKKHEQRSAEIFREKAAEGALGSLTPEQADYAAELIRLHGTQYSKLAKAQAMLGEHPAGFAKDLIAIQVSDLMGQAVIGKADKLEKAGEFCSLLEKAGTPEQAQGLAEMSALIAREAERAREAEKAEKEALAADGRVFLARTADGRDVYAEQGFYDHMQAHPDVSMAHIVEAIGRRDTQGRPFMMEQGDMGRTVGMDRCVPRREGEEPEMVYRKGRDGRTPCAPAGREAEPTSLVTLGMCSDDIGDGGKRLVMFTAFYGQLAPKEPWDPSLSPEGKEEAEKFWASHELVMDGGEIAQDRTAWGKGAPAAGEPANVYVVPDNDAEARAIIGMLKDNGHREGNGIFVTGQGWGASYEGLEPALKAVTRAPGWGRAYDGMPPEEKAAIAPLMDAIESGRAQAYGVELQGQAMGATKNIDHHCYDGDDRSNALSSIEQVAAIEGIALTPEQEFIAANDRGFIPAMEKLAEEKGMAPEEAGRMIQEVRRLDREAQGITPEQERQAEAAVAASRTENGLTVVELPHSKCATVTDRMYGQYDSLLVKCGDGELDFYGAGSVCMGLQEKFHGWTGGSLPESGFWGGYADPAEVEDAAKGLILESLEKEYRAECDEIARQCGEEGCPPHGSNYELRTENLMHDPHYAPLFGAPGDGEREGGMGGTLLEDIESLSEGPMEAGQEEWLDADLGDAVLEDQLGMLGGMGGGPGDGGAQAKEGQGWEPSDG